MTYDEAQELLEFARGVRWDFPSSAGRPLRKPADAEPLLARKDAFVAAARVLDAKSATELAANAWRLWMVARDIAGGRAFLGEVLDDENAPATRSRALALYGDGLLAWWQGEREHSRGRNEEAFALARAGDDPEALALAQLGLSRIAVDDGDHERGRELAAGARALAARCSEAMTQAPLHLEAQATRLAGDYHVAAGLFEASLALNRRIEDQSMVVVELHNLGHVEIHRGNADAAEGYFAQLPRAEDPYDEAMTRLNEAAVAFRRGDADTARAKLEAAEGIFAANGTEAATDDRFELDWLREQLTCAAS
jgi:tetratricopeptide (TPR) repeat protein